MVAGKPIKPKVARISENLDVIATSVSQILITRYRLDRSKLRHCYLSLNKTFVRIYNNSWLCNKFNIALCVDYWYSL